MPRRPFRGGSRFVATKFTPSNQAVLSMISPQTSVKLVGGYGTAVDHVLAMAFDGPSMDGDLRRVLDAHEVVLEGEWPDVW